MFYLRTSFSNVLRHRMKSILGILICVVVALFLFLYTGNIAANEKQLADLPGAVPIKANISNLNGKQVTGLQIPDVTLAKITDTGMVKDLIYTVQMAGNFLPEAEEDKDFPKIEVAGCNTQEAFPAIDQKSIRLREGQSLAFLQGEDALCLVNEEFMKENGIRADREIDLALYWFDYSDQTFMQYKYLDVYTLRVAGSYAPDKDGSGNVYLPHIILPVGFAQRIFAEHDVSFQADSARFALKDPMQLNAFKEQMAEKKLLEVNIQAKQSNNGVALVVDDKTFIQSAQSLQRTITTMREMLPLFFGIIILVGFISSYLLMQSRRREFAIMRSLGVKARQCAGILLIENIVLELCGLLVGTALALAILSQWPPDGALILALIFGAYTGGMAASVALLMRFSTMQLLTRTD